MGGLALIPDASGMVKLVPASAVAGPVIAPPQGGPAAQGGRQGVHEPLPQFDTTGAAAMAAAHFKKDVDDLRHRMEKIEKSLQKMDALEKRVDQLVEAVRTVAASVPRGVDKQVQVIWQGLQNTPDYNLYEKFVCKSCGTAGAAQVKSRCGHCGTEGWFGRREAKPLALPPATSAPRPVARPPVKPPARKK